MPSIPNDPARSMERRESRPDGWKEEQADMELGTADKS